MFKLLVFICAGVKVTATLFIATIQIVSSSRYYQYWSSIVQHKENRKKKK
jgi:hypothetical protein